jgi:biotin carboxyl carrier protein
VSEQRPAPPEGLTIVLLPEGLDTPSRQVRTTTRRVRRLLTIGASVLAVLILLAAQGLASVVGARDRQALLDENLALKARILEIESRLDAADRELRRLRLYEAQLEGVDVEALSGRGPLEDGVPGPDPEGLLDHGHDDELGWDDLGVEDMAELGPPGRRLDIAGARTEQLLEELRLAELELGRTVEVAVARQDRAHAVPSAWPLEAVLTSRFGWRRSPFTKRWKFHYGIDLSAPVGTVIRAPGPGEVIKAEYHSGYGRMLEIDHGYEVVTRYAHNARLLVDVGDVVAKGQPISTVGMTGSTTGPHLHYEVYVEGQPVDPMEHLE